jgi:hypothetical protein
VAVGTQRVARRIGIAKGQFVVPDTIDDDEAAVAALFRAGA